MHRGSVPAWFMMNSSRHIPLKMPSATSIVARSYPDRFIGVDNALPWHLRADLKHFKERTKYHAIIMGRKTLESLGKPLPNRQNIVLSRTEISESPGLVWAKDPETALLLADVYTICNLKREFYVVGGETIYKEFSKYINSVWLTDVFTGPMNGDARFDFDFPLLEWWVRSERDHPSTEYDDFPFRITHFERRRKQHRLRSRGEFLGHDESVLALIDQWAATMGPDAPPSELQSSQLDMFD